MYARRSGCGSVLALVSSPRVILHLMRPQLTAVSLDSVKFDNAKFAVHVSTAETGGGVCKLASGPCFRRTVVMQLRHCSTSFNLSSAVLLFGDDMPALATYTADTWKSEAGDAQRELVCRSSVLRLPYSYACCLLPFLKSLTCAMLQQPRVASHAPAACGGRPTSTFLKCDCHARGTHAALTIGEDVSRPLTLSGTLFQHRQVPFEIKCLLGYFRCLHLLHLAPVLWHSITRSCPYAARVIPGTQRSWTQNQCISASRYNTKTD